jgi:hypothetical protein
MPLFKDYYASITCIKNIGNFPLRSISHKNNEKKHLFKFYCFFFHVFFSYNSFKHLFLQNY